MMSAPDVAKKEKLTDYMIGNTHIRIVPPQISEDERKKRLAAVERTLWHIWNTQQEID